MKRRIILLLMLITLSFTVHSESINETNAESMVEVFLNKGNYIKIKMKYNNYSFYYYQKSVITEIEAYDDYFSVTGIRGDGSYFYFQAIYNEDSISLDDNYNLIIIRNKQR